MKRLSPEDHLFLWMERRHQPMHAGALALFDFPADAPRNYLSKLADEMRSFEPTLRPFNQRLESTGIGQYGLVDDESFDIDHHFKHQALPKPGRIRELLALVSAQHGHLMDRKRPLWEVSLIEGVHGKRFAFYSKVHHCLMDGVASMRLLNEFVTNDANQTGMPPLWALPARHTPPKALKNPSRFDQFKDTLKLGRKMTQNLQSAATVTRELNQLLINTFNDNNDVIGISAPESILNQKITGSRRFVAQSFSFERIRTLSKTLGCTINDIAVVMCGGALRRYLIWQDALPKAPLITAMPVSIRPEGNDSGGNQISTMLASLGTHIADPEQRLAHILDTINEAKQRLRRMNTLELQSYTLLSLLPSAAQSITGKLPALRAFNIGISNVPGPKERVYWNGAPMTGMYPVSIVLDDLALNITLLSYHDQLEFGLIACRRTLPSIQRLLDYLEESLVELEQVVR